MALPSVTTKIAQDGVLACLCTQRDGKMIAATQTLDAMIFVPTQLWVMVAILANEQYVQPGMLPRPARGLHVIR